MLKKSKNKTVRKISLPEAGLRFLGARISPKMKYAFSVNLIINYACNFRCKYCDSYNIKKEEMTTRQIFDMLDDFASHGTKRLGITGGEPLLRQDIGEIISHAKKQGMTVGLTSNGSLVSKRIGDLKDLDLLILSFDGPPEIQDECRVKGAYDMVIDAIKAAKKAGLDVWVTTVITKNTRKHLRFILNKAEELDFKILFQPVYAYSYSASSSEIDKMAMPRKEFIGFIRVLKRLKKTEKRIMNSSSYFDYLIEHWPSKPIKRCWAGRLYCGVDSDGAVAPCSLVFDRKGWPNGLKRGFVNSFRSLGNIKCKGCFCVSFIEMNLACGLNPEVVFNALKTYSFLRR